jgi:diguanylate cyclase (GGDEF)-like protein
MKAVAQPAPRRPPNVGDTVTDNSGEPQSEGLLVGRAGYQFTTNAIIESGYLRTLKVAIGGLCLSMAALGWLSLLHPLGPHGAVSRTVQFVVALSALLVGIWWMIGRWPSYSVAVAFVAWADISVGIATTLLATPEARMSTTIDMALIGLFAALILGTWVLAAHCALAAALIIGVTAYSAVVEHMGWFALFPFQAPAVSSVVVLPIVIQAIIEGFRRAMRATARHAMQDPMTGLHNRRGMYAAVQPLIARDPATILVAAVVDLDRFKQINDGRGHQWGDDVLRAVAVALQSSVRRGDIVARVGGDEFIVIAALDNPERIDSFIERIQTALDTAAGTITASVGVAWRSCRDNDDDFVDAVLRHADRAMYDAKRQGGNQLIPAPPE